MKTKRIQWLDFAKGLTILDVVLLHTSHFEIVSKSYFASIIFRYMNFLLCIPAMPIFFAISGYLYKPTKTWAKFKTLLYKKISSFIIPYFVFMIIIILQGYIRHKSLVQIFHNHFLWPVEYLWFLYALFFIFIIIGLLDLFHINLFIQIFLSIIFMFGQMIMWSSKEPFSPTGCIGSYMICFYIGYILKKYDLISLFDLNSVKCTRYLLVFWVILLAITHYLFGTDYTFDLFTYQDFIIKLFSIIVFFSFFSLFNNSKNYLFKYFDKYGRYTLIIYLVSAPVAIILNYVLKGFITGFLLSFITFLIISLTDWYISIFVCYLSKRSNIIKFIFYPRRFINLLVGNK